MKEMMVRPQTCPPATLSNFRDSHAISKPKIRIVHVLPPEIITTDIANFRDLVQRLTGKPESGNCNSDDGGCQKMRKVHRPVMAKKEQPFSCATENKANDMAPRYEFQKSDFEEWAKEEEEKLSGNLLGGLGDLDGFIQSLLQMPTDSSI